MYRVYMHVHKYIYIYVSNYWIFQKFLGLEDIIIFYELLYLMKKCNLDFKASVLSRENAS